jgi:phenylacetate-CoA ligase
MFLGSEGLPEKDREYIKTKTNATIVHWYGHSERLVHAGNCPYSNDFHIYPFYGFTELLNEKNQPITQPFVKGRIVATGYDNKAMPLIRYDTGDEAEYADTDSCKCGFKGRSFRRIHGRKQDYIYLDDKTKVSLTAFIFGQHFDEFALIKELQLEQAEKGELLVRVVLEDEVNFDTILFRQKLENSVNGKLSVNLKVCDSIEKTPAGKHIFIIQKISD